MSHDTAIPLGILTGFLGAGKTTLLNRILNGEHGLRIAVLVNDFGNINIDADLVVGVEDDVISLANGCVCCSIRDDLVEAVDRVLESTEGLQYVLLEASGVADPMSLATTFNMPALKDRIRLDGITCVVDAEQLFSDWEYEGLRRLKLLQIGCADLVVLNKVDLAGPEEVSRVRDWIDEELNRVRVVEAVKCDVPLEILLSAGRLDLLRLQAAPSPDGAACHVGGCDDASHDHTDTFETWSYESEHALDEDALREMVKRRLPASVYRCKGIIFSAATPDRRVVLQIVGRRADIELEDAWGDRPRKTQIVAIGERGHLDRGWLREAFDACLVAESQSQSAHG